MGTPVLYDFEGTTGNLISGTGHALQGSGGATYEASAAVAGSTGGHFVANDGAVRSDRLTVTVPSKIISARGYLSTPPARPPTTTPTATRYTIGSLRHASGIAMRIEYDEFGQIGIEGNSGGFFGISATNFPVSTKFGISLLVNIGSATVAPYDTTVTGKVYTSAGGWTTQSGSTLQINTGSNTFYANVLPIAQIDVGAVSAATPGLIVDADYWQIEDGRLTEFGPPPSTSAPTANAGPDQDLMAGTTATLTSASTVGAGGGTITSYSWTPTEIPPGAPTPTLSTPTAASTQVTGLVAGVYKFNHNIVQSSGGLSSPTGDEVVLWVYPQPGVDVRPYSETHEPGITVDGGAATGLASISDVNSATALKWPDNPTGQKTTITWNPFPPGPVAAMIGGYYGGTGSAINRSVTWYRINGTTVLEPTAVYGLPTSDAEVKSSVSPANMTALGTVQADRRALKTVVSDSV